MLLFNQWESMEYHYWASEISQALQRSGIHIKVTIAKLRVTINGFHLNIFRVPLEENRCNFEFASTDMH